MNFRFPQTFALLMLLATLASFGMPPAWSGRATASAQVLFSPFSAPAQWLVGDRADQAAEQRTPPPIVPATPAVDERARLAEENHLLRSQIEVFAGQLETLRARQHEYERVGDKLRGLVHT